MTMNGKRWYYIAVKKLPALLRGLMKKHHVDFYCLYCLHFETRNERESLKKRMRK